MGYGFLVMLLIVFTGNYCIHLFYKAKYEQLLLEIGDNKFILIKDIATHTRSIGYLSLRWRETISDLILVNGDVLIIPHNSALGGLVRQKQPIIQLVSTWQKNAYNAVSSKHFVKEKKIIDSSVKFILAANSSFEIDTTISLIFKFNSKEQKEVYNYLEFI